MDIYLETVLHPGRNEANSYPLSVNALTENIITFIVQVSSTSKSAKLSLIL